MEDLVRLLVILGLLLLVVGGLLHLGDRLGLGRLPGGVDLTVGPVRIWVPVATSIILSAALTVLLNLWSRR